MIPPRFVGSLVGTAVALCVLGGCAPSHPHAYDGPARPKGEVAAVHGNMFMAAVREVDGRAVRPSWDGAVYLLPGAHMLRVEARWSNRCRQRVDLPVEVGAGTGYHLYVVERRPVLSPIRGAGEVAVKLGTLFLWPVTLPMGIGLLLFDYTEPVPPKGHELEVGLAKPEGKEGGGVWHSHPPSSSPSGKKMETMYRSVWR